MSLDIVKLIAGLEVAAEVDGTVIDTKDDVIYITHKTGAIMPEWAQRRLKEAGWCYDNYRGTEGYNLWGYALFGDS